MINIITSQEPISVLKTIAKIPLGLSSGHLYYILVLLQLTIITPFLIKVIQSNRKGSKVLFLVTPLYLLLLYVYNAVFKEQFLLYQTFFPAWFVFYYCGLWVKFKGYKSLFKTHVIRKSIILCLLALLASIIEAYALLGFDFSVGFASSQIKVSSFIYTFALINLLIVVKPYCNIKKNTWLSTIGDYSYGVYYVHMVWVIIGNKILSTVTFIDNILPVYQILQLLFTIAFSMVSIWATRKVLGKGISARLLGF